MTICINTPHTSYLTKIIGEFVDNDPDIDEFKAYKDGCFGGWTIELESNNSFAFWRDVAGCFSGTQAWEK